MWCKLAQGDSASSARAASRQRRGAPLGLGVAENHDLGALRPPREHFLERRGLVGVLQLAELLLDRLVGDQLVVGAADEDLHRVVLQVGRRHRLDLLRPRRREEERLVLLE